MKKQAIVRFVTALVILALLLFALLFQKKQEHDADEYRFRTPPPGPDARPAVANPNLKHMPSIKPNGG